MNIDDALAWIHSRLKFNIRPGLIRVNALLELLGYPERELSMIHVAGTNGKGSTVAFTRSIFMAAGLKKVATFTSPYIVEFGERMSINALPIPDEKLIYYVELLQPLVAKIDEDPELTGITEFEIITAMAFKYFADEQVDLAIIEVGLGGLLDSTNVISPVLTGITTIGLDHIDILGKTLEEIAAQKAGIIKPQVPVVTGNIVPSAFAVIGQTAQDNQSVMYHFRKDYDIKISDDLFDFESQNLSLKGLKKSLAGRHQFENAAMAIELASVYAQIKGIELPEQALRTGVQQAFWAARMEEVSSEPKIIIDGAHNTHAMKRLLENIEQDYQGQKLRIIFSAITTKDISEMISMLKSVKNAELILTTFDYPKALNLSDFKAANVKMSDNWQESVKAAKADETTLVTGSLYFVSQVREFLLKERGN